MAQTKKSPSPADIVRDARRQYGLTQTAFAENMGVTQGEISRYESGKVDPPSSILIHCLEVTGRIATNSDISAKQLADRIRRELGASTAQGVRSTIWQMLNVAQKN